MSGGFFDYNDSYIGGIACEVGHLIAANERAYSKDTLRKFKQAAATLERASNMAHCIDMLVSGDDDEKSFKKRWESYGL